jgi:two-component system, cell cycle sensor histidine kinase and response regulator CckA
MNPADANRPRLSVRIFHLLLVSAALALIAGSTWLAALKADRELRDDVLQQALMVATAVNTQQVAALSGTVADLVSSDYQRIKEQLTITRLSNPDCRFLYLISRRSDGMIIFHVDSEPADSKDYSPPGQTYDEAPGELHDVLTTGRAAVRGPYRDRWGTWVSAFVPLHARVVGSVQMVFGMDIDAADWIWTVALRAVPLAALVAIAVMLGLLVALLYRSRRDIRTNQEVLRESEEKYRLLFEYSPLGHIYFDENGGIVACNDNFVQIIGSSREALLGLNMLNLPDKKIVSAVRKALNGGIGIYEDVYHSVTGEKMTPVRALFAPMEIGGGRIPGGVGIVEDITERKRAEEEKRVLEERLQRSEKMEALGQLAGGVAHDLNNVLGILSGYSELLLMDIPEGHRFRGHVEKIMQSTEKGAAIIQDLLTLARRGVTASAVIDLNSVVLSFLKTPVFEKMKDYHPRVTFRTECDKNLLNIKGSPVHLEKTLMNLVSNAAESISGQGEVMIQTESRYLDKAIRGYDEVKEGDYAILMVSDTGMGIPAENREKIFEPFYTKKTMGRSGTGLGLAIVWGTVKDHNGYIDLQTEVGKGSTFTLYFPVTRDELTAQQQKAPIDRYKGNGESVLVVDDIAEQRDVASGLLTRLGYEVHVVSNGEDAVEYLKGNKADILVLDMIMAPGIDGLETYERVLEVNPTQKAILVSGFSETDRVREAQKLGAGAYVKKPYVMETIGTAIRNELSR